MKKRFDVVIGLVLFTIMCGLVFNLILSVKAELAVTQESNEYYSTIDTREVSGIVDTVDIKNNLPCVFIVTSDGNRWAFIADGYAQGDSIMCKFDTCGTANIEDDILLAVNGIEIN